MTWERELEQFLQLLLLFLVLNEQANVCHHVTYFTPGCCLWFRRRGWLRWSWVSRNSQPTFIIRKELGTSSFYEDALGIHAACCNEGEHLKPAQSVKFWQTQLFTTPFCFYPAWSLVTLAFFYTVQSSHFFFSLSKICILKTPCYSAFRSFLLIL